MFILAYCPRCRTSYKLDTYHLGKKGGRQLRCAKCKSEWYQTLYPTFSVKIPESKDKTAITKWMAENNIPWTYHNQRQLEPPREEEPDMDDILTSIGRILSEDDDGYYTFWLYHKEDALLLKLIWA